MAENLFEMVPKLVQLRYANDCSLVEPAQAIAESFILSKEIGPTYRYFPAGNKSILIDALPKDSPNERVLAPFNFVEKEGS